MEKKQNDKLELSLDQMDKISGGAGECGGEQENGTEVPGSILNQYVPDKQDTRLNDQQNNGTIFNPFKNK